MLRFFTPSHPAGRLEYLLIQLGLYGMMYLGITMLLALSIDPITYEVSYNASNVTVTLCIVIVAVLLSWITCLRRMYDLHMGTGWIVCNFIPVVSTIFHLYLLMASGVSRETFAPYGDNPYNPDSWVPKPPADGSAGPSVTYRGEALMLPGETAADLTDEQAA